MSGQEAREAERKALEYYRPLVEPLSAALSPALQMHGLSFDQLHTIRREAAALSLIWLQNGGHLRAGVADIKIGDETVDQIIDASWTLPTRRHARERIRAILQAAFAARGAIVADGATDVS